MSLQFLKFESDIRSVDLLERVDTIFCQGIDYLEIIGGSNPLFMKRMVAPNLKRFEYAKYSRLKSLKRH